MVMKIRVSAIPVITYVAIILGLLWLFTTYLESGCLKKSGVQYLGKRDIISKLSKIKGQISGKVPNDVLREIEDLENGLSTNIRIFASDFQLMEESCGNGLGLIKDEVYTGNVVTQKYWYEGAWILNETSPTSANLEDLITILLVYQGTNPEAFISRLQSNLITKYSKVAVFVGVISPQGDSISIDSNSQIKLVVDSRLSQSEMWLKIWKRVRTEYVLVGRDIEILHTKWINLERSVRLLNGFGEQIFAVGGATRNSSGHWKTNCFQADIQYYSLNLEPGYKTSTCDCMKCGALWESGPFVARTAELELRSELSPDLMFLDWFLRKKMQVVGSWALSCPDILYMVNDETRPAISKQDWKGLSSLHHFADVSIHSSAPTRLHSFSCEEAGLVCDPSRQADSHLLPWCCTHSYNYIISVVDHLADRIGFHYELDSGSLLGGVKFNNFIPWDIDGDLYIPSQHIHLFDKGAEGTLAFEKAGIEVYGRKKDNYWDIGAGYFQVSYGGISFEMMGKRGSLSLDKLPGPKDLPTRILVGNTWARVHSHPGEYLRGRYGPGYLRHVQSWRFVESMSSAFDYGKQKSGSGWKPCSKPEDHSCLDRYPNDGNLNFLPHYNHADK